MKSEIKQLKKMDESIIQSILKNPKLLETIPDKVVFFDFSRDDWSHIFTPKRIELLNCINTESPKNLTELAELTGRSVENIYRDIKYLEKFEIVETRKNGRDSKPELIKSSVIITF